jgi:acetyl esterase/lipase/lysophospholipase L1-like esterase
MKKILVLFIFIASVVQAQQKVIPLYNGAAPGSENWNWDEQFIDANNNMFKTNIVYNVSKPTLTVYAPDASVANKTAVIICPGGGFHLLSINSEGIDVANWLTKKGVTCFVLKYRLIHSTSNDPIQDMMNMINKKGESDDQTKTVIAMGISDGREAIAYVRKHAAEYNIDPDKIGIMGFSAGGTVAASAAFNYTADNKPDFVAPIYPFFPDSMQTTVATDAPPMFIVAASNDQLGLALHSIALYNKWLSSKHSAELHMYVQGGHGFGMRVQNIPTDSWIDRFGDWLQVMNLANAGSVSSQQVGNMQRMLKDWPNIQRYADDNEKLKTMPDKNRVVFMGNSITEGWRNNDSAFFISNDYVDRGISGQTTPQMLTRFREDVINLKPAVVVILAGINDIAQNTGPIKLEDTYGNIISMAELAKANDIKVVITSTLPANVIPWRTYIHPADSVIALNKMLKTYADKNKIVFVDYYTAMMDDQKGLPKTLSDDGVHPTLAGYKIMEPLAQKGIADALKQK